MDGFATVVCDYASGRWVIVSAADLQSRSYDRESGPSDQADSDMEHAVSAP